MGKLKMSRLTEKQIELINYIKKAQKYYKEPVYIEHVETWILGLQYVEIFNVILQNGKVLKDDLNKKTVKSLFDRGILTPSKLERLYELNEENLYIYLTENSLIHKKKEMYWKKLAKQRAYEEGWGM